jgi:hypothetical protein
MNHVAVSAAFSSLLQPLFPVLVERHIGPLVARSHCGEKPVVQCNTAALHFLVTVFLLGLVLCSVGGVSAGSARSAWTDGVVALGLDYLILVLCPAEVVEVVDLDGGKR